MTRTTREAKRQRLEDAFVSRAILAATPKAYVAFIARLDQPPRPHERLLKTMRTPAPWDER